MKYTLNQITPEELIVKRLSIKGFLQSQISPLIGRKSWMQDWEQLAKRFQLFKFSALPEAEALKYS
ncbi:hypothetical protein [Bacillus sp. NTK034]|uniref:hypothetical protein n=1 Tax=Bacillus sp. NTK034 TaxID=2802176 RepID=UPI001FD4D460|nr:hypothetical protein [Bacillus sp. NTK034]